MNRPPVDKPGEEAPPGPRVLEAFVPLPLRSANHFSERHWSARYRERREWELALRAVLGRPRPFARPVAVTLTRVLGRGERPYDAGNLEGGSAKQLVDALVRLGWLPDDSPRRVRRLACLQDDGDRGRPGTRLRVEELGELE